MVMSYQALKLAIQIRLLETFAPNIPSKERRASSKWELPIAYWLCYLFSNFLQFKFCAYCYDINRQEHCQ